ncbi:MAG: hypothetical protein ACI35S_06910 [Anaeroplasma sp.]
MKLRKKLVLSALALAACATTMVSTTFAWYVSNSEASIGATAGSTAGTEVSGNLLVSDATKTGSKFTEQAYVQNLATVACHTAIPLAPVTKDTEAIKPSEGATGWHDVNNDPVAIENTYSEFAFFVMSTKATEVNITFGVENKTTTFKNQLLLNTSGAPTGVNLNDSFHKDAVEALRMEVFQVSATDAATDAYTSMTSLGVFKVDTFKQTDLSTPYETKSGCAVGGNAQTYYTEVMGAAPVGGSAEAATAELITKLTVTANEGSLLIFRYWLEGTDTDCFDSCIAQNFEFNFGLSAVASASE